MYVDNVGELSSCSNEVLSSGMFCQDMMSRQGCCRIFLGRKNVTVLLARSRDVRRERCVSAFSFNNPLCGDHVDPCDPVVARLVKFKII
jgi:hypothetical protein